MQPDAWLATEYRKEFGPKGQWIALKKLADGEPLSSADINWLRQTSADDDVDGRLREVLISWQANPPDSGDTEELALEVAAPKAPAKAVPKDFAAMTAVGLVTDMEGEIAAIKNGTLSPSKAQEVAKFRQMQLNTIRLVVDAVRHQDKAAKNAN